MSNADAPLFDRVCAAINRHREIRHACISAGFPEIAFIAGFLDSEMTPDAVRACLDRARVAIARRRAGIPAPVYHRPH